MIFLYIACFIFGYLIVKEIAKNQEEKEKSDKEIKELLEKLNEKNRDSI